MILSQILEVMMVVSFGLSWPLSIIKSYKTRTTKGKSIFFLYCIWLGYAAGIASKLVSGPLNYVIYFYILNFIMVFVDIALYYRNRRLDRSLMTE